VSPLDWPHPVAEVPRARRTTTRRATDVECAAVAAALEVPAVTALEIAYTVVATATGSYVLDGTLDAHVTQTCVVSLEPIAVAYRLPLSAEFRADAADVVARPAGDGEEEAEILALPDIEPIEHGQLAIGRVAFETLGAGLDPHPRRPDAVLDWQEPPETDTNPFAVLAKLKRDG
jgi:uncharacterized metal-binding protein YceD (DUF177 family)